MHRALIQSENRVVIPQSYANVRLDRALSQFPWRKKKKNLGNTRAVSTYTVASPIRCSRVQCDVATFMQTVFKPLPSHVSRAALVCVALSHFVSLRIAWNCRAQLQYFTVHECFHFIWYFSACDIALWITRAAFCSACHRRHCFCALCLFVIGLVAPQTLKKTSTTLVRVHCARELCERKRRIRV